MRIGIVSLLHESNTFVSQQTDLSHFEADVLLEGDAVRERFDGSRHELGGFLAALRAAGVEAVPIFSARAVPWGVIASSAWRELLQRIDKGLDRAGKLDGLLVAAHGATVSEPAPDADGQLLAQLRKRLATPTPIVCTLDPHANLSPAMIQATTAIIGYRTNPHVDQLERGLEAADLICRTLRGEIRPVHAAAYPPMAINIECQNTSEQPARWLVERARALQQSPRVLAVTVLLGFPYADVEELGTSIVVVTDDDRELAQQTADGLALELWNRRHAFATLPISMDKAVAEVGKQAGPACLLDVGDNVGGGGHGDSTHLAHALIAGGVSNCLICLVDPESASQACAAGVGKRLGLSLGGKAAPSSGPPLVAEYEVVSTSDGRFSDSEVRHGGFLHFNQGPTAMVRAVSGLTAVVISRRTPPFSLGQLTSCGADPRQFEGVVAKGVHAPVAAYREVCQRLIRVNTPGVTAADMTSLVFHRRRRPMFPFEKEMTWCPDKPQ